MYKFEQSKKGMELKMKEKIVKIFIIILLIFIASTNEASGAEEISALSSQKEAMRNRKLFK